MAPMSRLVDSSAHSFLTLPGEIRNAIYEALLAHEHPVAIVDGHAHLSGTSILTTCRQIATEATPVLYSRNSFLISTLQRGIYLSGLLTLTEKWLRRIERQIIHVRTVVIDTDAAEIWEASIDVQSLLYYLWDTAIAQLKISFSPMTDGTKRRHSKWDVSSINKTLSALVAEDSMGLKRYARFPRLVDNISLCTETGRGMVVFSTRHCPIDATTLSLHFFSFTTDGKVYSWTDDPMQPAKSFFCDKMVRAFIRKLLPSDITPTYDLDNHTAHPVMPPIVSATGLTRWAGESILSDYETYTKATMTTTSLAIGYDKLKALEQVRHDLGFERTYGIYPRPRVLELNFKTFKPLQLKEVRIDAIALITSTFKYPNQTDIRVKIISGEADGATYNHTEFKLINVRNTVQDSLDRICRDSEGFQAPCPDLWIDGTGEPYEAIVEA